MSFFVEDAIWERFPGMTLVVAYADGIDNTVDNPALSAAVEDVQRKTKDNWQHVNAQSHPLVAAWRNTFRSVMGLKGSNFPSSVEALTKRVLNGKGISSINPIVDFYNAVSLRHTVPAGGWDVDGLAGGDIHLRHTTAGETFHELGAPAAVVVSAREVCYADEKALITRHFVWRQSEEAKVTPQTRRLFLVSEILAEGGDATAAEVENAFENGLRDYFGVTARTATLRPGDRRWDWPEAD